MNSRARIIAEQCTSFLDGTIWKDTREALTTKIEIALIEEREKAIRQCADIFMVGYGALGKTPIEIHKQILSLIQKTEK